jgi:hypothetical protein
MLTILTLHRLNSSGGRKKHSVWNLWFSPFLMELTLGPVSYLFIFVSDFPEDKSPLT